MEPASFIIEFPAHLPRDKWQYCLDQLSQTGASVETKGDRIFRVVCSRQNQVAMVGWKLFQTHFSKLCRVIATSGVAKAQASAYAHPRSNEHTGYDPSRNPMATGA
jgi:hypothetical protein